MGNIDKTSLFNITYGLFVLSSRNGDKDGGCIVNTVCQIADSPLTISVSLNKKNYTNELIQASGEFNASVIGENATFDLFRRFGFASGRDTDKFSGFEDAVRAENGIYFVTGQCNTLISAKVVQTLDMGSHWLYIAQVTDAQKLFNGAKSCTYSYYQSNIKPKPVQQKSKGWVCRVCGYVYEGDELPADFVCPVCKHGPEAFEILT